MDRKSPKEQLAGHDLIGFSKRPGETNQVVRRASSAKVTTEPGFRTKTEAADPVTAKEQDATG